MALDKTGLKNTLETVFSSLDVNTTPAQKAQQVADAIDAYVKTAIAQVTIPTGAVLIAAQAGVPNPAPIPLTGDPNAGTGGLS